MHDLGRQAYERLYGHPPEEKVLIHYHGRFKEYNANIRRYRGTIEFGLSRKFHSLEPEIQIGIMQLLLNRLNKTRVQTDEIRMYQSFLKNLSDVAPITDVDPELMHSYSRVNEEYFHGMMTLPNLVWGNCSARLLGTYTYATDTIMISSALRHAPPEVLDSVMYHEMLHKKHKFSCAIGRTHSHTKAFKLDDAKYKVKDVERRLTAFLRRPRVMDTPEEVKGFLSRVMGWR